MENRNFNFEWEFENFRLRSLHEIRDDLSSPLDKHMPVELVKFTDEKHEHMYTVAYFMPTGEGYSLKFVGSRPFEDISAEEIGTIWRQLQAAQKMLDAYHEACKDDDR